MLPSRECTGVGLKMLLVVFLIQEKHPSCCQVSLMHMEAIFDIANSKRKFNFDQDIVRMSLASKNISS